MPAHLSRPNLHPAVTHFIFCSAALQVPGKSREEREREEALALAAALQRQEAEWMSF